MRLLIGLCKYCVLDRGRCLHYHTIREKTKEIKAPGTLVHHCPEYYQTIPIGTKVKIELKSYGPIEDTVELDYDIGVPASYPLGSYSPNWESLGMVTGVIEGKSAVRGLYSIKLDVPQVVGRPSDHKPTGASEIKLERTCKRANEIEILEGEAPQNK